MCTSNHGQGRTFVLSIRFIVRCVHMISNDGQGRTFVKSIKFIVRCVHMISNHGEGRTVVFYDVTAHIYVKDQLFIKKAFSVIS